MADIFKEVDEDLRRDKLDKLWKKYSFQIIGMAVAVVLAVAGVQGWQAYDLDQRGKLSDRYGAALDLAQDGDTAAGLDVLIDLSEASDSGYAGLAAFEEARLRVESGDTAGAIALWDRIAGASGLGPGFKEAATLFSVLHQIDNGNPADLRARLVPLATDSQPFRSTARELLAVIALGDGDTASAREFYTQISDDREAPSGLRQRAAQMLAALKE